MGARSVGSRCQRASGRPCSKCLTDLKVARLVKLLCWNGVGVGLTRKYLVGSTFDVEPSVWPTKAELGDTKYGKGAAAACAKLLAYTP